MGRILKRRPKGVGLRCGPYASLAMIRPEWVDTRVIKGSSAAGIPSTGGGVPERLWRMVAF